VPAVAVKVVDVLPAGTVTEAAGTGSKVLLLESETDAPPVGAAPLSATVQFVLAALAIEATEHEKDESVGP
jgi:hypothetical protein